MAEVALNIAINKLVPLLARGAHLLKGVHREVESLKNELESIYSFLKEADAKEARGESNDIIKTWVKQVRDVAYRTEDVIDHYMHQLARRRQREGVSKFLHQTGRLIKKLTVRHEIAAEITKIKTDVVEIKSRADRYGLSVPTQQEMIVRQYMPIASLFTEEADLVGIKQHKDLLTKWLRKEEGTKRLVFSVVGMGGLGKTTLAKQVFDNQNSMFDCHAWITVSQTYSTKELTKKMILQFYQASKQSTPATIKHMDGHRELVNELRECVQQKRYVVVFDDVWSREFCEEMLHSLPENNKCSRIIFTTRSEDVAPSRGESLLNSVYKLPTLSFQESWQLFCNKVFQSCDGGKCPLELEKLSTDIVKKCDGLPLAIVTVGGVLSTKQKNVSEWKKFQNSLRTKLDSDKQLTRVTKILSLSYHDLPDHLKPCLLYVAIFPEDCSIRCSRLVRQWTAEGFVKAKDNEILEDVAEEYLTELIHRSLIQVSLVDYSGKVRECRVHDLMREVIILKSKELKFCQFLGENVSNDLDGKGRRLSILKSVNGDFSKQVDLSQLRSFCVFKLVEFPTYFTSMVFANFKLLKMLDLEDAPVASLSECLGDLFHLSYLSVRNTKVEKLPKSIGKLQQLETLDTKESLVRELPNEIKRLRNLRHLLGRFVGGRGDFCFAYTQGVRIPQGLGCAESLQKLSHVDADSSRGSALVEELKTFKQLRKLGITNVRTGDAIQLCNAIQNMEELRSMEIILLNEKQVVDLESIASSPPLLLQRLILKGRPKTLPSWISKLHNLVRVAFYWSGLTVDPIQALQDLPNLLDLNICYNAYMGEQLHFGKAGFQKLKVLSLRNLNALRTLIIEGGSLPRLEKLHVGPFSPRMMKVSSGIQHLKNLKLLEFYDMRKEFCMSLVPEGPNYSIIQHIPTVYFCFEGAPLQFFTFTPARYGHHYR